VACIVVGSAAVLALAFQPWTNPGPSIRSDGSGYHLWTHAIVDRDYSFCAYEELRVVGAISAEDPERNVCLNKYPPGLALLKLPVMGPLAARGDGQGNISHNEHVANDALAAVALVALAVLLTRTGRRLDLPNWATQVAVSATVLGTGLFHYATFDASFSHLWSALGFAVLVHSWASARGRPPSVAHHAALAITTFFVTLIRPANLLPLAVLTVAFLVDRGVLRPREWTSMLDLPRVTREVGPAVVAVVAALTVQLSYIHWATGEWRISSYGSEPFLLDHPMQRSVLVSYERGLFTWYPLVALVLVGGVTLRRTRGWTLTAIATVGVLTLLYGYWANWPLGGGFGHRGFVDVVPIIFLPLVGTLAAMPRPARTLVTLGVAVCVVATTQLMAGYWAGTVPETGTTRTTYWSHLVGEESWFR
jgi:hypothetical protein